MALEQNETEFISCSLQGKSSVKVLLSINNVTDDDANVSGDIKNGIAKIKFESTFGGSGIATAKISNNKLIYTIEDKSSFIQAYMPVPNEIELIKSKK